MAVKETPCCPMMNAHCLPQRVLQHQLLKLLGSLGRMAGPGLVIMLTTPRVTKTSRAVLPTLSINIIESDLH